MHCRHGHPWRASASPAPGCIASFYSAHEDGPKKKDRNPVTTRHPMKTTPRIKPPLRLLPALLLAALPALANADDNQPLQQVEVSASLIPLGVADSANQGTVTAKQLENRPLLCTGRAWTCTAILRMCSTTPNTATSSTRPRAGKSWA